MGSWLDAVRRLLGGGRSATSAVDKDHSAEAGALTVQVAPLPGDDGRHLNHLINVLHGRSGLNVVPLKQPLSPATDFSARLKESVRKGRDLMADGEPRLIIYGEAMTGRGYRLRFISPEPWRHPLEGGFSPLDRIDLPFGFDDSLGDFLYACVLAAIAPKGSKERQKLAATLKPSIVAAERAISQMSLPANITPALNLGRGILKVWLTARGEDDRMAQNALKHFNKAMLAADGFDTLEMAMVKAHLAEIQLMHAAHTDDPVTIEQAVEGFKAALEVITADLLPDDHAALQLRLGGAYHKWAMVGDKTAHLKRAVQAYGAAAKIWSKARNPNRWADIQNNIGTLLTTIGEFTHADAVLAQAVSVFQGAAGVWTRQKNPQAWANLQHNMGVALFTSGKRSNDVKTLQASSAAFKEAMKVYEELDYHNGKQIAQKSLGRVERLLSARQAD